MNSPAAPSTPLNALARIRPDVRAMHAYTVQSADGLLKMDAMENPFGLPPHLQAALGQRLGALERFVLAHRRAGQLVAANGRFDGTADLDGQAKR